MGNICRLSNGNELEIRDFIMNSSNNIVMRFEKPYEEVKEFLGQNIIESIDIINAEDRTNIGHYSVYIEPISITVSQENIMDSVINEERNVVVTERVANIVTVEFSTPNTVKQIEDIKKQVGIVNPDLLNLNEYKLYAINNSKDELKMYLLNNPLESTVHSGETKKYSITEEKQTLLMKEIMLSQVSSQTETPYETSWNATGEVCEPWSLEDLIKLSFEIASVVKPLVTYQQKIEEQIMSKESIEEIKLIEFDFESNDPRKL